MQTFIASHGPSHNRTRLPAPVRAGLLLVMAILVLASGAAEARVRWVGDSNNCEYHTIAQAIAAAGSSSDPDEVRITKDHPYNEWHGQALVINNQDLTIGGNWDYCGQPDSQYTVGYGVVSGFGGEAAPVFRIRGTSHVNFYGLAVTLGDPSSTSLGGGIDFAGKGSLNLRTVILQYNVGYFGGAIRTSCAESDGSDCPSEPPVPEATVTLGDNVYIYDNQANQGGGIALYRRTKLVMKEPYTFFHRNHADFGGAIYIEESAHADIGSPHPAGTAGVFFQNTAAFYGGAIYARTNPGTSGATRPIALHSVSPNEPLSFIENQAPAGAAIAVFNDTAGRSMSICSTNVYYHGNQASAPNFGSVVFVAGPSASFEMNSSYCRSLIPEGERINCGPLEQSRCNEFSANTASDGTGGAIFQALDSGRILLKNIRVNHNSADQLLYAFFSTINIRDSVIDHNSAHFALATADTSSAVAAFHVSIVDNEVAEGGANFANFDNVGTSAGNILVINSIVDQDAPLFRGDVDNSDFVGLLVRNPGSFPLRPGNVVGIPSFIPGFYRLQPYSEGIDRVMVTLGSTDPDGTVRNIDNTSVSHTPGYFADIGAYESTAIENDVIFATSFEVTTANNARLVLPALPLAVALVSDARPLSNRD